MSGRPVVRALAAAALMLSAALALPALASAAPFGLDAFAAKVDGAIAVVRDAGSSVSSATVAADVATRVETLLPLGLEVTEGTATISVADTTLVHQLTGKLRDAGDGTERTDVAAELTRHLGAMRAAIGGPGAQPSDDRALAALLKARPVTTDTGDRWLSDQVTKLLEAIARWLSRLTGGSIDAPPPAWSRVIPAIVVAIPLLLGLWILARSLRRRRAAAARIGAPELAAGPVVAAAADLPADPLAYAEQLAGAGRHREAVRALYGGAARSLVESGVVEHVRTRTNHEMLRDVRAAAPLLSRAFEALTDTFEVAWYGHADPGARGFSEARATYRELLRDARPQPRETADRGGDALGAPNGDRAGEAR